MLTPIKKGTNVPTDKTVIAVNEDNQVLIGRLYDNSCGAWHCINEGVESDEYLYHVTHFITIENLLRLK